MKGDGGEKGPGLGTWGGRRGGDALARKYPRDKKQKRTTFFEVLWLAALLCLFGIS